MPSGILCPLGSNLCSRCAKGWEVEVKEEHKDEEDQENRYGDDDYVDGLFSPKKHRSDVAERGGGQFPKASAVRNRRSHASSHSAGVPRRSQSPRATVRTCCGQGLA